MKKLSLLLGAVVIAVTSLVSTAPKQASADQSWQPEVIASSAQVRFEVQATGYDSATNKYKYKFSWLMPKYRTYSFAIDGKVYQPKVIQNGVIETPFWFSPDITYTINIYPYANGRGAAVAQGSFKAPSVNVTPEKPALTQEEEFYLMFEHMMKLEDIPSRTMNSIEDAQAVAALGLATKDIEKYTDLKPYLSSLSIEVFDQMPIMISEMDAEQDDMKDITRYTPSKVKVYKGGEYASIKATAKNLVTGDRESLKLIFVKENGTWKIDLLQSLKIVFEEGELF